MGDDSFWDDDGLKALVAQAYAAALDPALWEPWALAALREFGAAGGIFTLLGDAVPSADKIVNLWQNPRALEDYVAGMALFDPQIPHVRGLTRSTIYLDTEHVDRGDPGLREYLTWIEGIGGGHHMTAAVLLDGGAQRAGLSLHYRTQDGPPPHAQQERLAAIFPAIGHAFALAFRHGALLQDAFWEGVTAPDANKAALLLDERGRVLRASAAAHAIIDGRDGLTLAAGTLGCERTDDAARLGALAAAAVGRYGAVGGAVRIARRSGRAPFVVSAYPLARERPMLERQAAAALVTIVDPAAAPSNPQTWRTTLGLTAREAELAGLLMAGHSVGSAATTLAMAVSTARTHLRAMFRKTGTDRQSALLQLLARLQ